VRNFSPEKACLCKTEMFFKRRSVKRVGSQCACQQLSPHAAMIQACAALAGYGSFAVYWLPINLIRNSALWKRTVPKRDRPLISIYLLSDLQFMACSMENRRQSGRRLPKYDSVLQAQAVYALFRLPNIACSCGCSSVLCFQRHPMPAARAVQRSLSFSISTHLKRCSLLCLLQ
jgi:hypothetical protein